MKKKLWIVMSSLVLLSLGCARAENLVPNGDFETESSTTPGTPADWTYSKRWIEGNQYWVTDDVKSGKRAVKIVSDAYTPPEGATVNGSLSISTRTLSVPPANTVLDVSAWIKAKDVVSPGSYYKLRFTIYFWDKDGKKLRHSDMLCTDGSRDWTRIESSQRVPEGTTAISLAFGLTACTGTGWIDDVQVTVHSDALTGERVFNGIKTVEGPVIIPQPWQVKEGNGRVDVESLVIKGLNGNPRLQKAVEKWLAEIKIPYSTADNEPAGTLLISGDASDRDINKRLKETFAGVSWKDLGDQGYFLSVSNTGGKNVMYLGANTEQGRFYGLQTLKQLLEQEGAKTSLRLADIVDKPTVSRRGMAMGMQWFGRNTKAIERLAELKCNYIHNQGSFLSLKFCGGRDRGQWRVPFTEGEINALKKYREMAEENFIDVCLSFAPRGGNPLLKYSSDEEINTIVDKISVLYDAGFRNFALNFDDLGNIGMERLTEPEDIKKFDNDLGKAHYYFTSEIYNRLRKKHHDITFSFLPYTYGPGSLNEEQRNYLKTVGRLPKEIIFVSCATDEKGRSEALRLTGRKHLVWDNYFAGWGSGGAPVFVPPLERDPDVSDKNVSGFIFLPMGPADEDAAMVSWLTATDYMWSPQRYNSTQSFSKAVARAAGGNRNLALLEEYYRYFVSDIRKVTLPSGEEFQTLERRKTDLPDDSSKQRISVLQDNITKLNEWKEKLRAAVPEKLFAAIDKEIDGNISTLQLLMAQEKEKTFPVRVQKTAAAPQWDRAAELTGFYVMAGKGERAKEQTSVRLMYDDRNLYMKIVCSETEMKKIRAKETERDRNVFTDDCVEIFLDTKADRKNYFHIVVNSIGTVYDGMNFNKEWNGTYTINTKAEKDSWTLEITIPFKTLGLNSVKPGDRWNFNVCRERYAAEREFSSYALLVKNGFHAPECFWTMKFE